MVLTNTGTACGHDTKAIANDWMLDPLDHNEDDERIDMTRRQVVRIALVATEVGARFQRHCVDADPMAWMLAPRRAFDDRPPVEACVTSADCLKAVLIYSLGLDLDIPPDALAALMADDDLSEQVSEYEPIG